MYFKIELTNFRFPEDQQNKFIQNEALWPQNAYNVKNDLRRAENPRYPKISLLAYSCRATSPAQSVDRAFHHVVAEDCLKADSKRHKPQQEAVCLAEKNKPSAAYCPA